MRNIAAVTAVWAGIVRVSFVGTRGGDSFHADQEQVEDLQRAIAGMRDARLEILPAELDISGGLPLEKRPSLLKAVEGVEAGVYAGIMVSYLSRLGRNIREQLRAWDRVEAAGGKIIVVREGIDTSTAAGRLQRNLLLSIAEHEREAHAERFEERRRKATAAGIWQRRQTPLGYRRDPATRKLVPDDRADDVRGAFLARRGGAPIVDLSRQLGMTPSGVRQMLANRVYLGELKVGAHVNPAAHEPLIGVDLFAAVQRARVPRPPRSRQRHPALLAGLVRCCGCGHLMSRGQSGKTVVYICHGLHSAGRCPAPAAITAARIDAHVEKIALHALAQLRITTLKDDRAIDLARAAVTQAELELRSFLEAVDAAGIDAADFADAARARRERLDEARAELDRVNDRLRIAVAGDPVDLWNEGDVDQRNRLLRGLVEVVLVRRAGGRGQVVPIDARVRVLKRGTRIDLPSTTGGEVPIPILPLDLPELSHETVLRVPLVE